MTPADLRAVDDLCKLALTARRLGCGVHLTGTGPDLRELIRLAGVDDVLWECPISSPPPARARADLP